RPLRHWIRFRAPPAPLIVSCLSLSLSLSPECGGELTATYGSINSPGYPGNYPPNRDCYWTVSVSPGLLITFAFGTLSLEHHANCSFDYLEVRDGSSETDPLIGKYCGTSAPPPITSSSNKLWIKFKSDSSVTRGGFRAIYKVGKLPLRCGPLLAR
uniref:CUB domain-containing protein n=1 Tax=Erpetoichthys calabaricus TaxID=27687 RepID=A0A8C4TGW5_ERPCA